MSGNDNDNRRPNEGNGQNGLPVSKKPKLTKGKDINEPCFVFAKDMEDIYNSKRCAVPAWRDRRAVHQQAKAQNNGVDVLARTVGIEGVERAHQSYAGLPEETPISNKADLYTSAMDKQRASTTESTLKQLALQAAGLCLMADNPRQVAVDWTGMVKALVYEHHVAQSDEMETQRKIGLREMQEARKEMQEARKELAEHRKTAVDASFRARQLAKELQSAQEELKESEEECNKLRAIQETIKSQLDD